MEDTLYSTYGEPIPGTDENDIFTVNGVRSEVFGEGGNDSIDARNYLITVHGGDGNDTLIAGRSYIDLRGDDGNDYLIADAHQRSENIANVTLTGGEGDDIFSISSGYMSAKEGALKKVSSVRITDFGTGNDSLMLADESVCGYVSSTTNDDGDLVIRVRHDGTELTFEGISDIDKLKNVTIDGNVLSDIKVIPVGLELNGETLSVHSEYEGALWLGGTDIINDETVWGDDEIKNIDASADTVGGRMLGGNGKDNEIRANNYGSLLWGGFGGDDTLRGGDGADMFFVGFNEGNTDVIDCGENDLVILMDIDLSDLATIELTTDDDSIDIEKDDGSHIGITKVDGARTTTVQLADNSKWQYTYSDRSWQFKP